MESSGDCSVVRDCGGGPKARLRLFTGGITGAARRVLGAT